MKKARYKECDAFYKTEAQKSYHFDEKKHKYFVIKMLDNIQPCTDQRKSVGLVVTDTVGAQIECAMALAAGHQTST